MSQSSQQYYDHQREFESVELAEQIYLIEEAEYLQTINDGKYTRKTNNRF